MASTHPINLVGTVLKFGPGYFCTVALDGGEEIRARVPKKTARGMYRIPTGERVRVAYGADGLPRVTGFDRNPG